MPTSLNAVVTPSPDVLFQKLDGEAVLLNLNSENYFGLNSVGTRVWELLGTAQPLSAVLDALASEYAVDRQSLERDLTDLVDQLARAGLVKQLAR